MIRNALMVQGTTSDAGKSTLVAALGRILKRRGVKAATESTPVSGKHAKPAKAIKEEKPVKAKKPKPSHSRPPRVW